ncbi:T-cell surface glycoprotein CD3 epsilon chain [Neopelma chrysocephalum]|uniref:T-cell surface glycoprotein CD3 epsilon chain n=1 Tax=Neopelma chrysocephalum TaxID=114329 RepID=UPI000FCD1BA8|nr:T-cell surface glycoprotein CD3 epsilon chain [Neopelma chrysocephalum]
MRLELSWPLLGLLLWAGLSASEEFLVEISGTTVTITCPLTEDDVKWKSTEGTTDPSNVRKHIITDHKSSPINLSCSSASSGTSHELYLNARVCANCEELDALTVTGIIAADLLITLGVLILVYYFSKGRKGRASPGPASRPRGQKMQRPPPVPNPDYEPIRKGQREVYAGLESRGF